MLSYSNWTGSDVNTMGVPKGANFLSNSLCSNDRKYMSSLYLDQYTTKIYGYVLGQIFIFHKSHLYYVTV